MNTIIMYGAEWCKDCIRAKEQIEAAGFSYEMRDITDPEKGREYTDFIMETNNGKRILPTLIIDGQTYPNPNPSKLENILNEREIPDDGITRCSNGKELQNGDTVLLTRDLDVKGSNLKLKQGTALEKIKLTGDPEYIDCKVGKATLAIKTMYVKKKG